MRRTRWITSAVAGISTAVLVVGGTLVATQASAAAPPPPLPVPASIRPLPAALDYQPEYSPQVSCDPRAKPGVVAFAAVLQRTYPDTGSFGIVASCSGRGGVSEHEEGRAFDWEASIAVPHQRAEVRRFLGWLTADHGAMARRIGIMYAMWNGRIWGAYSPDAGWRAQACSGVTACHRNHVHLSFTWDGAYERTSFWTGVADTRPDYGPCVLPGRYFAAPYRAPNFAPCPSWTAISGRSGVAVRLLAAVKARETYRVGAQGTPIGDATWILGVSVTRFTPALVPVIEAFQNRIGVPVTGVLDPRTLGALRHFATTAPGAPTR